MLIDKMTTNLDQGLIYSHLSIKVYWTIEFFNVCCAHTVQ